MIGEPLGVRRAVAGGRHGGGVEAAQESEQRQLVVIEQRRESARRPRLTNVLARRHVVLSRDLAARSARAFR